MALTENQRRKLRELMKYTIILPKTDGTNERISLTSD